MSGPAEPWHPWVAALLRSARVGPHDVLVLDSDRIDAAMAGTAALPMDERTARAHHLVLLMATLHRAHGDDVMGLLTQLAEVASTLLMDAAGLRDAFDRAGLGGPHAERLLGTASPRQPVTRDPGLPGILDVRLRR